jgi:cation diffusion facilitator family transporter
MASGSSDQPITIYGAIAANLIIAIAKFVAGAFTGSSAMLSEGIHSTADTGNQLLLLLGIRQSRKPPDDRYPFGHGKEMYFWSLIVAIILFGVGGGMSLYEGITHLQHPTEIGDPTWNYVVLSIGLVAEGASWAIALRELVRRRGRDESLWQALRTSKDPAIFTVVGEDTAALLGLLIAFVGVFLGHQLESPSIDAAASIAIGVVLVVVAGFLAYESKGLLVGESADPDVVRHIRMQVEDDPAVQGVRRLLTMHLAADQVLLNLDVEFRPSLSAQEVASSIDRLEAAIQQAQPQIRNIFIEAEALAERARPTDTHA